MTIKRIEDATSTLGIMTEILKEVKSQRVKWGEQNHPSLDPHLERSGGRGEAMNAYYKIPSEELAKQLVTRALKNDRLTWAHIAIEELCEAIGAKSGPDMRAELIQTAAVLVSWINSIDRNSEVHNDQG